MAKRSLRLTVFLYYCLDYAVPIMFLLVWYDEDAY